METEAPIAHVQTRAPFLRVSCPDCSNKQIIFSRASSIVACTTCGRTLAEPTGGRAKLSGDVVETLE